jgi:hypothetical protein
MAHAIAARANASNNRPLRPGDRGGSGGRGRERGAQIEGAVVVTLTVTFVAELPGVTGVGETVQVASEGAPVQVKLTLWLNPPSPAKLKVYAADCPGATVAEVGEPEAAVSVKSWPVPVRLRVCVAGLALSVIVKVPLLDPATVGVKVTLKAQLAPAATLEPQVLVWEKSPLTVMPVRLRAPLPVLLSVTL